MKKPMAEARVSVFKPKAKKVHVIMKTNTKLKRLVEVKVVWMQAAQSRGQGCQRNVYMRHRRSANGEVRRAASLTNELSGSQPAVAKRREANTRKWVHRTSSKWGSRHEAKPSLKPDKGSSHRGKLASTAAQRRRGGVWQTNSQPAKPALDAQAPTASTSRKGSSCLLPSRFS